MRRANLTNVIKNIYIFIYFANDWINKLHILKTVIDIKFNVLKLHGFSDAFEIAYWSSNTYFCVINLKKGEILSSFEQLLLILELYATLLIELRKKFIIGLKLKIQYYFFFNCGVIVK